jgi:hypothetical protein
MDWIFSGILPRILVRAADFILGYYRVLPAGRRGGGSKISRVSCQGEP